MTISSENTQLVQESFRTLLSEADLTGSEFFTRLFRAAPAMARLFPATEPGARRRLIAVFAFTIEALDDFEIMMPALRIAGGRYRDLGVGRAEYRQFGQALEETLEWALRDRWTKRHRSAWSSAFAAIVAAMEAEQDETRSAA